MIDTLKQENSTGTTIGIVPVPQFISDIVYLPGQDVRYIRMEKVIMEFLELIFSQYEVSDKNYICVTRNADVSPEDEAYADEEDFRFIMRETLHKRRRLAAVRLEVANPLTKEMEKYLCGEAGHRSEMYFPHKNADEAGFYLFSDR